MADDVIIVGIVAAGQRSKALDWGVTEALLRELPLRAIHSVESRGATATPTVRCESTGNRSSR